MSLLVPVLVKTEEQLYHLFLVIALSFGAVGLKFGLWALLQGGAYLGAGYAGLNNNDLAIALVMSIPFCWYARCRVTSKVLHSLLLLVAFASVSAVIMTNSRGASLALLTTVLLLIKRSKRRIGVVLLVLVMLGPALYLFSDHYSARMATLKDPASEASAHSRLVLWQAAFEVWKDHPWVGVGFGNTNFQALENEYLETPMNLKAHETYLQVLVDSGVFALLSFGYLLFGTIVRLGRSGMLCERSCPRLQFYPYALQTSLIALAQYGLSGGRERYDFLYFTLMTGAAWLMIQGRMHLVTNGAEAPDVQPNQANHTAEASLTTP
jgi:probable O-glycosylation ligase (exosortase A-associated)